MRRALRAFSKLKVTSGDRTKIRVCTNGCEHNYCLAFFCESVLRGRETSVELRSEMLPGGYLPTLDLGRDEIDVVAVEMGEMFANAAVAKFLSELLPFLATGGKERFELQQPSCPGLQNLELDFQHALRMVNQDQ